MMYIPYGFEIKNSKFAVLDHQGKLYFVDGVSKDILGCIETGPDPYQPFQFPNVKDYLDLDKYGDGETLYRHSPGSIKGIAGISLDQLAQKTRHIYPDVKTNEVTSTTTYPQSGLIIETSHWIFSLDNKWHLHYKLLNIRVQGLKLNVYYARTPERLIQLQNELGLGRFPNASVFTRLLNNSKRITLHHPRKMMKVVGDAQIDYFDGYYEQRDVFVKRIQVSGNEHLINAIEGLHSKYARYEHIVKHLHTESDERYIYFAYQKMDMDLCTFISDNKLSELEESSAIAKQERTIKKQKIIRGIVKALAELHSNNEFHPNFAPEHVLINLIGDHDLVVKVCGLGSSIVTGNPSRVTLGEYLNTELLRLGRTLWNMLSNGDHEFKADDILPYSLCQPMRNVDLEGLKSTIDAHLI